MRKMVSLLLSALLAVLLWPVPCEAEGIAPAENIPEAGMAFTASVPAVGFILGARAGSLGITLTIRAPSGAVRAGEEFDAELDLTENSGFSGFQCTLVYDPETLECEDVSLGEILRGTFSGTNPLRGRGAFVLSASGSPITGTGILAAIRFRAKADIPDLQFSVDDVLFTKANGDALPFHVEGIRTDPPESGSTGQRTRSNPQSAAEAETEGDGFTASDGKNSEPSVSGNNAHSGESAADASRQEAAASAPVSAPFTDTAGHWAERAIAEAARRGFVHGYPDGTFRPDEPLTRAQFVTVLWNLEGRPAPADSAPFRDLDGLSAEFCSAIAWAYEKGYVQGTGPDAFTPRARVTRQAAMKILFQYSGGRGGSARLVESIYDNYFEDSAFIPAWAKLPLYWGIYNTVLTEQEPRILDPAGTVTRGLLADMIVRYTDNIGK